MLLSHVSRVPALRSGRRSSGAPSLRSRRQNAEARAREAPLLDSDGGRGGANGSLVAEQWLERTRLILGPDLDLLWRSHVVVVGQGGVGSWAAEFLCRSGVGHLTIIDADVVSSSNRNRQLPALTSTIGKSKVEVMAARLRDISPNVRLTVRNEFLECSDAVALASGDCSFIVDCIDSIAPKEDMIEAALRAGKRIVSSMGAGGKLDPSRIRVADISQTFNDRMARLLRKNLRRRCGLQSGLPVVFSTEPVAQESMAEVDEVQKFKRSFYGTMSYMPAAFGLHLAAFVICELCGKGSALQYPNVAFDADAPPARRNALKGGLRGPGKRTPAGKSRRMTRVPDAGENSAASSLTPDSVATSEQPSSSYPWGKLEGRGIGFDGTGI